MPCVFTEPPDWHRHSCWFQASVREHAPRGHVALAAAVVAAIALSACGTAWVSRSGATVKAPARESGCAVEFVQQPPQRRYEDLGRSIEVTSARELCVTHRGHVAATR